MQRKQPLKCILLHAYNAIVSNQQLMHGCNVFVVDPEMLVWDGNMAQIHDTARLQCFCGRDVAVVRYENFKEIHSATFLLVGHTSVERKTSLDFILLRGCNVRVTDH